MNRDELNKAISEQTGFSQTDVKRVLQSYETTVLYTLQRGDEVRLSGFGTFRTSEVAERQARNPRTGESVTVPAGKRIKFKPAKAAAESID